MLLDHQRNRNIVDGVRAIGILLVILFHVMFGTTKLLQGYGEEHGGDYAGLDRYIADFPTVLNIAWQALGSEMVFFVSGFLLSYLLFRELTKTGRVDLRNYLVKRVSRILPMYGIALVLFALEFRWKWWELLLNLGFVSKIFDAKTIIPVGWSLEVMIQVYLILPFLCAWLFKRKHAILISFVLVGISLVPRFLALAMHPEDYAMPFYELAYGGDASPTQKDIYYLLIHRATPFLFGMAIAYLTVMRSAGLSSFFASPLRSSISIVVGLALMVASGFLPIHDPNSFLYSELPVSFWLYFWTFQRAVFTVGIALVFLPAFYGAGGLAGVIADTLSLEVWRPISHNIYSIYLFHFLCMIPAAALVLLPFHPDRLLLLVTAPDDLDEAIPSISNLEALAIFIRIFPEHR